MSERIEIVDTEIRLHNIETRLPFHFGIATMEKLPHCFVGCKIAVDGDQSTGIAADHFPPKWFTKDPNQSLAAEIESMLEVVQQACGLAKGVSGATPFDCWRQVYASQAEWAAAEEHPPLLWSFGVSLVERALIDGYCRGQEVSFHESVTSGALGMQPSEIYPELEGVTPRDALPEKPSGSIRLRHTVGHEDPLTERPPEAPNDGLPVTLVENIRSYGVDRFKLKIGGNVSQDRERLREILTVIDAECEDYRFTLDANEQYASVNELRQLWDQLAEDAALPEFGERLLFMEQPFPRSIALSAEVGARLDSWDDAPPIIIDESDAELDSFGRALSLGYSGTSYKNCKGVFKGMANACLAHRRRMAGEAVVISGEDLTTIGPVSLQQDLAAMAALGLQHVERNGHHYFKGLSMFDEGVQGAVLESHADLFTRHEDGFATLLIEDGELELSSVNTAPFGCAAALDLSRYESPPDWRFKPPRP